MAKEKKFHIIPPKGTSFRQCVSCGLPFVYDGTDDTCIWCLINKEKDAKQEEVLPKEVQVQE